jgi:hypothetical protein
MAPDAEVMVMASVRVSSKSAMEPEFIDIKVQG